MNLPAGTHACGDKYGHGFITLVRIFDCILVASIFVICWKDTFPWKVGAALLLVVSFMNHARRWSGWYERDSYLRFK